SSACSSALRVIPDLSYCLTSVTPNLACRSTHMLVATSWLVRRCHAVEVVGEALLGKATGRPDCKIAASLCRARSPVRGWLQRFGVGPRIRGSTEPALPISWMPSCPRSLLETAPSRTPSKPSGWLPQPRFDGWDPPGRAGRPSPD